MLNHANPCNTNSQQILSWLRGLLLLFLLLLISGCGSFSTKPQPRVVIEYREVLPEPLPDHLLAPIMHPRLPDTRLTEDDLLGLIARYHRLLEVANSQRQEVGDLWPKK